MALSTFFIERLTLATDGSATTGYVTCKGGKYIWSCEGTFNGGSYQLQAKTAFGTAVNIAGATLNANGFLELNIAADTEIRSVETGATSAMYQYLTAVP